MSSINDQFLSNHQPSSASKHQTSNFYHQPSTSTSYNTPSSTIQSSATVTSLPITGKYISRLILMWNFVKPFLTNCDDFHVGEYQSTSPVVSNQLLYSINDQFLSDHQPSSASKHQSSFYHQPSTSSSYNTPAISSIIQSSVSQAALPTTAYLSRISCNNNFYVPIYNNFFSESCVDILNKIYKVVLCIKLDVKENSYKITRLEKAVCDIKEVYGNNKSSSTHFVQNERFLFPIKNQKELELFEKKLDDANFKSDIVSWS